MEKYVFIYLRIQALSQIFPFEEYHSSLKAKTERCLERIMVSLCPLKKHVNKDWNRWLSATVEFPFLEICKIGLDKVLSNLK